MKPDNPELSPDRRSRKPTLGGRIRRYPPLAVAVCFAAVAAEAGGGRAAGAAPRRPIEIFAAIAERYGIDPDPDALSDLGSGGFAEVRSGRMPVLPPSVLRGRPPARPGEPVAVKIYYENPRVAAAHEAAVSRRLQATEEKELFITAAHDTELNVLITERVPGSRTLEAWLEDRRILGPRTIGRIAGQLRRTLRGLEQAGLAHSDLKPDNILIGPRQTLKVFDFGIAADVGGYAPGMAGWRGGDFRFASQNQLENGPASYQDDRHVVAPQLQKLLYQAPPPHRAAAVELARQNADASRFYWVMKNGIQVLSGVPGRYAGSRADRVFGRLDHHPKMRPADRVFFQTWEDAIGSGYRPCKTCKPEPRG